MGHQEISAANGHAAAVRVESRRLLRSRRFLCFHQSELPDHSFPDVVRRGVHLHGAHVDSAHDAAPMVKRIVGAALLFLAIAPLLAIEKVPLAEYKDRSDRMATRIQGNLLVLRAVAG